MRERDVGSGKGGYITETKLIHSEKESNFS